MCKRQYNLLKTAIKLGCEKIPRIRLYVSQAIINSRLAYGFEVTSLTLPNVMQKLTPYYQLLGIRPGRMRGGWCSSFSLLPHQNTHRAIGLNLKAYEPIKKNCFLAAAICQLQEIANQPLPPVVGVDWFTSKLKIDPSIRNQYNVGSNPKSMVADVIKNKCLDYEVHYSNGSRALGRIRVGVTGTNLVACYRLPDKCSIFTAELVGLSGNNHPNQQTYPRHQRFY